MSFHQSEMAGPTLGLEMPTTVDEWYNVLKPSKSRDAKTATATLHDEVPLTGCGHVRLDPLCQPLKGALRTAWKRIIWLSTRGDQKPVFIPADERYKECIEFFHKLYSEGIMDQEFFTQDGSMADAKLKNEEVS